MQYTIFNFIYHYYISFYLYATHIYIYINIWILYKYSFIYIYTCIDIIWHPSTFIVGQGPSVSFIGTLPSAARGWLRPAAGSIWRGGPPSCGSNPTTTRRRTSTKGLTNINGFLTWINLTHLKGEYHIYIYHIQGYNMGVYITNDMCCVQPWWCPNLAQIGV